MRVQTICSCLRARSRRGKAATLATKPLPWQAQDGGYQLYAWSELQGSADADAALACMMKTDDFSAVYGVTAGGYNAATVSFADGSQEALALSPNAPYLETFPGRGNAITAVTLTDGNETIRWPVDTVAGETDAYPGDGVWERIHSRLAAASWDDASSEAAIQQFQLADSKVADGTVSQWPAVLYRIRHLFCQDAGGSALFGARRGLDPEPVRRRADDGGHHGIWQCIADAGL